MELESGSDLIRLRIALVIGAGLVLSFMAVDLFLLPPNMYHLYLFDRLFLQISIILITVAVSFWGKFLKHRALVFAILLVALSYSNYWLILRCWQAYQFSFPYEGTILYAFYCVFVLGVPFKLAFAANIVNIAGFLALMIVAPVYGDRVLISASFVVGSLFICVYARYRLDRSVALLKESNDRLFKLSKFDPLTDLLNRRALRNQSEKLLAVSMRHKVSLAVLMLDLDDFKKFNDCFGHQQGDEAIKMQAKIMKSVFKRETDITGRYGGEEFIVVLSDIDKAQVNSHCEQLLTLWQEAKVKHAPKAKHSLMSCSIGAVFMQQVENITVDALIDKADQALYKAKENGKACFELTEL